MHHLQKVYILGKKNKFWFWGTSALGHFIYILKSNSIFIFKLNTKIKFFPFLNVAIKYLPAV